MNGHARSVVDLIVGPVLVKPTDENWASSQSSCWALKDVVVGRMVDRLTDCSVDQLIVGELIQTDCCCC